MGLSLYVRNAILAHVFGDASFAMPAASYAALFLTNPEPGDITGATPTGTEASYSGYAREAVTFGSPSGGVESNTTSVTFPVSGSAGGTANYVAIFDAITGGKLLAGFGISAISLASGAIPTIGIGAMTMTATTT